jgi:hypothetical protein
MFCGNCLERGRISGFPHGRMLPGHSSALSKHSIWQVKMAQVKLLSTKPAAHNTNLSRCVHRLYLVSAVKDLDFKTF